MRIEDGNLYIVEDVAKFLHCTPAFVRKITRDKKIGSYRNGKRRLYSKEHIQSYLKSVEIKRRGI
ncbi:MAG: helix-turn-helix domain-containing protein [Candidatus Aenigmatarchaeota archaeon]|nr:MAG: helix-turn-helix domain-containing protein [Candidatus Aenigmarchaeota archaeon]